MFELKPMFLFIFLLFSSHVLVMSKKLIQVHEIFRHGARYPLHSSPRDKSEYALQENELGELTLQGKHMQYVLGKIMYDRYWKALFEGTPYINKYHPSQFYIKSTNVNRTIESVQSQLLGLLQNLPPSQLPIDQLENSLPPFLDSISYSPQKPNQTHFQIYGTINTDFHAIPIHEDRPATFSPDSNYEYSANPYDQGDFLVKYSESNCPNQKFWGKQNMASPQAMRIKGNKKVMAFLDQLSEAVGQKVKFETAYIYIDDYECAKYLGREHLNLFDNPDIQQIANFVQMTSTIFTFFHSDEQIKISNTRFLQTIVYNMKQAIIGKGPKMILFSAHDTTLMSLWAAFNLTNIACLTEYYLDGVQNGQICLHDYPTFASNIILQLWEEDNLSHSIQMLYNGVQMKIPICDDIPHCKFLDFEHWVKQFSVEDPNDVCGIREHYAKLYIVIAVLSMLALIFLIIYLKTKWKKNLNAKIEEMQDKKGYIENFQEKQPQGN